MLRTSFHAYYSSDDEDKFFKYRLGRIKTGFVHYLFKGNFGETLVVEIKKLSVTLMKRKKNFTIHNKRGSNNGISYLPILSIKL